ncbi:cytochrome c family protein [Geoglobus ahangari]|uniref:Cytochrome c family protein n=1 Tax=Geoglobus ahangari TaxID=113653 RepID=A0A0F7IDD9_9EURY|nr:multiheme c-type cytochrome [Geoglobus ahangari]AKG91402.1 cytochrome c family protein [Geoglobus ahangari]NOY12076.1 hypothetical protein [Archaeoglobi archaeon]
MKVTTRVVLLYILGLAVFFIARSVFVPDTFGELGHYRAASIGEIESLKTKVGENYECFNCHVNEYVDWSVGEHRRIACTSCHGLLKAHVADPKNHSAKDEFLSPYAYPTMTDFCLSCHATSPSKPESFPQISVEHGREEMWNCTRCHNPHNPVV